MRFGMVGNAWQAESAIMELVYGGGRGLGTFGLPQSGSGAEVAEMEEGR